VSDFIKAEKASPICPDDGVSQQIWLRVRWEGKWYWFAAIYVPPGISTAKAVVVYNALQEQIAYCASINEDCVVLGDWNIHAGELLRPLTGVVDGINPAGREFMKFIRRTNTHIVNVEHKTQGVWTRGTHVDNGKRAVLDLILYKGGGLNFRTMVDENRIQWDGSDHNLVTTECSRRISENPMDIQI